MLEKLELILAAPLGDSRAALGFGLPVAHAAYRVGGGPHLYRAGPPLPVRGGLMALCRVLRCNPLCRGGVDPVPRRFSLRPFAGLREDPDENPSTDLEEPEK